MDRYPDTDAVAIVIGMGEMGGVFARGLLAAGHPVWPVLRDTDPDALAAGLPDPVVALVAVGEADLDEVLTALPAPWRGRCGLLQNELLPGDWHRHGITDPTVIAVWFEKKAGTAVKVIRPSPVHGPRAAMLASALAAIDIPTEVIEVDTDMELALVAKNLYILVSNIAGLVVGGTVGELWASHRSLALEVAGDVLGIQEHLVGRTLPFEDLVADMAAAFAADPDHGTRGRSAPARLQRALGHADVAGLAVPRLREIAAAG